MRVKLLHMKQLNTALKTATSSRSFSILSSDSRWEMCSSGNRTRSVRPGGKYRSIRHTKISEIQTGNFGRMERALGSDGAQKFEDLTKSKNFCAKLIQKISLIILGKKTFGVRCTLSRANLYYLTNWPVARMRYRSITHVEKPNRLLTRGPLDGERANCFSIIQLVGQKIQ